MGSTNKTPNFKFPLFEDSDKPTWRGDINDFSNKAESAIDDNLTKVNNAVNTAGSALGVANTAKTSADTAVATATSASENADTASTIANDAKVSADKALTDSSSALDKATLATTAANDAKDKVSKVTIYNEADLRAALLNGGNIHVDSTNQILISSPFIIGKATAISGGNFKAVSGSVFRINTSNVTIDGARINGGGSPYSQDQVLISAVGVAGAPLTGIAVTNCIMNNSRGDNIRYEYVSGSLVSGNIIQHFLYSGIMLISCSNIQVSNNYVSDAPLTDGVVNTYGISVTDLLNTVVARSKNVTITGNTVNLIDWEGIDTHGGKNISIVGNVITACPRGIALVGGNDNRVAVPQDCVVSGNKVDFTGARSTPSNGILIVGNATMKGDAIITGNSVNGFSPNIGYNDQIDFVKSFIGGNNVPFIDWTTMTTNVNDVEALTNELKPQYKVDGHTVYLRGGAYKHGVDFKDSLVVTTLPPVCRPKVTVWVSQVVNLGNRAPSTITVSPDGTLKFGYLTETSTTGAMAWPLTGSYDIG